MSVEILGFHSSAKIELPLVSIIITNYNNCAFLNRCIESVFAQTYKNIECIVVDDKSTDNSIVVLNEIQIRHPEIKIIQNDYEYYQTTCGHYGFRSSRGQYVIFLDADDILLPNCVEIHIFTHLSSAQAIGFTTCDCMQVVGDYIVRANYEFFHHYVINASHYEPKRPLMKPINDYSCSLWPYKSELYRDLLSNLAIVNSQHDNVGKHAFPCTATSTNCFRRDALIFWMNEAPPLAMRETKGSLDAYCIIGIWLFSPSILINYPLVCRGIHDGSITGSSGIRAELAGFGANIDDLLGFATAKVAISITERLIKQARDLLKMVSKPSYIGAIYKIDRFIKKICDENVFFYQEIQNRDYVLDFIKKNSVELDVLLGSEYKVMLKYLNSDNFFLDSWKEQFKKSYSFKRQKLDIEIIKQSCLFDADQYLERYPDARNTSISPIEHFVRFGAADLHNPRSDFNAMRYLLLHKDVARAHVNPFVHYIQYGQFEGRQL